MKKTFLFTATVFCFTNLINAQAGQLDPSFGTNGVVKTNIGNNYHYTTSPANQILPLSNGSMYVLHGQITKRLSNGSVDSSFGDKGNFADAGIGVNKIAIQPDGKIVAAGVYGEPQENVSNHQSNSNFGVVRYNTNGQLDSTFSGDGKQTTDFAPNQSDTYDEAYAVAIQKDGKIVVAGHSNEYLSIARYNTDGSLDNTFDGDGLVKSSLTYTSFFFNYTTAIALQSDGKIVVAGGFSIVRFNTDGTVDKTFNGDGIHTFVAINSIAIQEDGKIAAYGYATDGFNTYSALGRLNTDGSLDKSFSGSGTQSAPYGVSSLALQKDEKIVTAGLVYITDESGRTNQYFAISRYNTDGSQDKSFSEDGKEITDFGVGDADAKTVAIQPDGKIVAGGGTTSYSALTIARYNTDGSLDSTFDKDGKLIYTYSAGYTVYNRTAIQKDGKIVAAGNTWNGSDYSFVIVRYNTDGSLDKTFSNDGIQITSFTGFSNVSSVVIQSDEKIVVSNGNVLARFNADGSADSTFLTNTGQIFALAIQKDGKILTAGAVSGSTFEVRRYNANGAPDYTFGKNGSQAVVIYDQDGIKQDGYAFAIAVQRDEKILVGAVASHNERGEPYTGSIALVRLNTNGSLDNTFSKDGKTSFSLIGASSCSLVIQNDGKIVIGGEFGDIDTFSEGSSFKRYNADGSIDTGFNSINIPELEKVIALQSDGKLVLGGSALIRYNSNGSVDSTFSYTKIQEPASLNDIAIAGNKLYIAGVFSSPNNVGLVARYLLDNTNTPPTVTLTAPADSTTRLAPAAHIKLSAAAADSDGTITKVEFYNGNKLLHTETVIPYGYVWRNVGLGNYTITAKAYDNSGNISTSAPVHISVVPNKAPIVSIISPADNQVFADTATIRLIAAASDTDGRITRVEFYNGSTLLRTEYKYPYRYYWKNIPAGTYTVTAAATDNWGTRTTSAPVTITVTSSSAMIVSNKPISNKTGTKKEISVKLSPNPATSIINLYTSGLQQNKPADISIMSISGTVLKKVQSSSAAQMQLDVSSLAKGVYTIKIVSGEKVMYKQFVKL